MRPRDLIAITGAAAALVALVAWWLRQGLGQAPVPAPVGLEPADPAQHFGAAAAGDAALADEVVAETHGDLAAAERRFEQRRGGDDR